MSPELIEFQANIGKQWFTNPSLATAHWIVARAKESSFQFARHKVAVFRSWTIEPVGILMQAIGFVHGIQLEVYYGGWGAYAENILGDTAWLDYGNFDAAILTAEEDDNFVNLAAAFKGACNVPLIEHPIPREKHRDWDGVPFRSSELVDIAQAWMRELYPLLKVPSKVLVVDLDNTLWQGVLGEDGFENIVPNRALQDAMLDLYTDGTILAICSKNNEREALESLRDHPDIPIRPNRLAAWRINWKDKAANLSEIAGELNVGLDSLVFLDDSPIERGLIRAQLPMVTVPELPDDPALHNNVLRLGLWFEKGTPTEEDKHRGQYYAQQRQHREAQATMTLEDYYRSLRQKVEIRPMARSALPRVVQLLQKTNQFNLTTRRHGEQQVRQMHKDPSQEILTLRAEDRFGDNGIVGVAILRFDEQYFFDGGAHIIDTFLLSCRAIGRAIETAFLSFVSKYVREQGSLALIGQYIPTERNTPAQSFYESHGFKHLRNSWWQYDLSQGPIECPGWIACT